MIQPRWLSLDQVLRLHEIQIRKYGGQPGIRDHGLLESAVLRPRHKHHYEHTQDMVDLAAAYAIAISGNYPFFDGDKRTAFYAKAVFLEVACHYALQKPTPQVPCSRWSPALYRRAISANG